MTVSQFRVASMDCPSEEQLIRMRLSELDGIEAISVDIDTRRVAVKHGMDPANVDAALQTLNLDTTYLGEGGELGQIADTGRERSALRLALAINAAFFFAELTAGLLSRSMGLVADALDMGADAGVYALSLLAIGTTTRRKNKLARTSGYLQLGLAVAGIFEVIRRFATNEELPEVAPMVIVSLLALAGNVVTLIVLRRVRSGEAHFQASWIFTANDIKVNMLVIVSAVAVATTDSAIPDLIAGAFIFAIVANGARRILGLARKDSPPASPSERSMPE